MTQPVPPTDVTQPPEPVVVEELTPLEAAFYALVLAALGAWLSSVLARVLRPWNLFRTAPSPQALWSVVPEWNREVVRLVAWLREHPVPEGWDRWEDEADVDLDFNEPGTDAYTAAYLAQALNYLVRIPDEVFNLIMADVVDGHNAGEGFEEIAARIEDTLTLTGSQNWPARARTISVTEVNGAANAGWYGAALRTEQTLGRELWKEWEQSHDTHVRPEHRAAGGQKRRIRQPFLVGGEYLQVPGAKNGSAWNIINCRCAARHTEAP